MPPAELDAMASVTDPVASLTQTPVAPSRLSWPAAAVSTTTSAELDPMLPPTATRRMLLPVTRAVRSSTRLAIDPARVRTTTSPLEEATRSSTRVPATWVTYTP